jgi:hypothetical protein
VVAAAGVLLGAVGCGGSGGSGGSGGTADPADAKGAPAATASHGAKGTAGGGGQAGTARIPHDCGTVLTSLRAAYSVPGDFTLDYRDPATHTLPGDDATWQKQDYDTYPGLECGGMGDDPLGLIAVNVLPYAQWYADNQVFGPALPTCAPVDLAVKGAAKTTACVLGPDDDSPTLNVGVSTRTALIVAQVQYQSAEQPKVLRCLEQDLSALAAAL